jgi:regulatory protein
MYLCSKSEKCISDIKQKLYSWNSKPEHHGKVLEELLRQNFIDEKRFASYYVKDKFRFNKWGKIKIRSQLLYKKIPESLIENALNQITDDEYLEMLKNVINIKRKQLKETDLFSLKNKLLRYASSKGFELDLILKVTEITKK